MNRADYKQWAQDFRIKFPGVGTWLWQDTPERKATRDQWYEDVFSLFELRTALAMNKLFVKQPRKLGLQGDHTGSLPEVYLPRVFVRTMNELLGRETEPEQEKHQGFLIYCLECMDSGFIGQCVDDVYCESCCPYCERGRIVYEKWGSQGKRPLKYAPVANRET